MKLEKEGAWTTCGGDDDALNTNLRRVRLQILNNNNNNNNNNNINNNNDHGCHYVWHRAQTALIRYARGPAE